jgi:hypothetical protein
MTNCRARSGVSRRLFTAAAAAFPTSHRSDAIALEERLPVQVSLGKVVRAIDVKEFAAKVLMASPNVPRAVNPAPQPPRQDTTNRLLRPSKLARSGRANR